MTPPGPVGPTKSSSAIRMACTSAIMNAEMTTKAMSPSISVGPSRSWKRGPANKKSTTITETRATAAACLHPSSRAESRTNERYGQYPIPITMLSSDKR